MLPKNLCSGVVLAVSLKFHPAIWDPTVLQRPCMFACGTTKYDTIPIARQRNLINSSALPLPLSIYPSLGCRELRVRDALFNYALVCPSNTLQLIQRPCVKWVTRRAPVADVITQKQASSRIHFNKSLWLRISFCRWKTKQQVWWRLTELAFNNLKITLPLLFSRLSVILSPDCEIILSIIHQLSIMTNSRPICHPNSFVSVPSSLLFLELSTRLLSSVILSLFFLTLFLWKYQSMYSVIDLYLSFVWTPSCRGWPRSFSFPLFNGWYTKATCLCDKKETLHNLTLSLRVLFWKRGVYQGVTWTQWLIEVMVYFSLCAP